MDMPPGFRFYPTEEELVSFYLHNKLEAKREDLKRVMDRIIPVLDIYEFNPWDLPPYSGELCQGDPEQCFFFTMRQENEARGGRPNRLTSTGYWKATGSPNFIYSNSNGQKIGVKRTMVFYVGRAPNGKKTDWKMNEYKELEAPSSDHHHHHHQPSSSSTSTSTAAIHDHLPLRREMSLCRVYKKSKCLRAFDRRPPPVADIAARNPTTIQQADQEGTSTVVLSHSHHDQNSPAAPILMGERRIASSPESSSSGDPGQLVLQAGGNTTSIADQTMPMAIGNEALWYWDDQMEWFSN
ncbi:hypothetical protein FNV43_RR15543 [Rhamnella rubrinervis]|uniref:NAC domain-containing protein n=1 Tax=Rhamnella rubrinervis TaxID=2594499 RepID=A0A8K0GXH9_9ROSA|nr:hypothetical protein FNV43_RR15543 [Rhamnella rubrinervis]